MTPDPLLDVQNLRTTFSTDAGPARAVDGVSFTVGRGETVGLVGESGCGKSVTALSILRLIDGAGRIEKDSHILLEGRDLLSLPEREMRDVRGNRVAMIWQEPLSALNPVMSVGDQIAEVARVHAHASRAEAHAKAVEMLRLVGIADPEQRANEYPHQLSGGMRQRVVIAMALVMSPALLIADEPTTALDVTIQAQILELLAEVQKRMGMSILLITHDLGVVAETASRVVVMYAGEVVEEAPVRELFADAHHPYTEGLMRAMPRVGGTETRLATIPGAVPAPTDWPHGCRFRERCPYAWELCEREHPPLYQIGAGHVSRCHLAIEPERRAHPHVPIAAATGAGAGE
ncbi:MAG: ABC transporter ATP-binding protein [Gemmatimonadaceae bacterium]|nr:ABC transporter ATP-binding protein [Gemmatimonadaceae bacterium]NUQ93735.1 ABC transporter ATP-binding protein [Gemmatimonadaceae bacterium]NUR19956.1 ABC transporter ATP-binding protein [Gemmatimonadaceae bacterium]NUS95839.1 ABC transporter ATP-binding protein [Gemmatimonadaceae bacterium]